MNDGDFQLLLDRIYQYLLEKLSLANRLDELEAALEKHGLISLLGKSQHKRELEYVDRGAKILILDDCSISEKEIRGVMKSLGLPTDCYEVVGYNEIITRGIGRYEHNTHYSDILVGPVPHSVHRMEGASSLITRLEQHPEIFPRTIRVVDVGGTLKITKSALRSALESSRKLEIA